MNKGSKIKNGLILSTNSFTRKEVLFLCEILNKKFKLKSTIHSLRALRACAIITIPAPKGGTIKNNFYFYFHLRLFLINSIELRGY